MVTEAPQVGYAYQGRPGENPACHCGIRLAGLEGHLILVCPKCLCAYTGTEAHDNPDGTRRTPSKCRLPDDG